MDKAIISVMVTFMFAQALRALLASLKKERVMVKEGGDPLPTSVWVYLLIEVALAPVVTWLLSTWIIPIAIGLPNYLVWLILNVLVIYTVAINVSRLVSILVAVITKMILMRKYKKQMKDNQEQEFAEYLRSQVFKD